MALKHLSDGSYLHTAKGSGVAIRIKMPQIEKRMRRLSAELPKLRTRALKTFTGNVLKTMRKTFLSRGGTNGVAGFHAYETITDTIRSLYGNTNRPMGGKLAEPKMFRYVALSPFSSPRPKIEIGWHDFLADAAVKFQEATGPGDHFESKGFRRWLHQRGVDVIPGAYVKNPRPFMNDFNDGYVQPNLQKWVDGYVRRTLANQIAKEMRKARAA